MTDKSQPICDFSFNKLTDPNYQKRKKRSIEASKDYVRILEKMQRQKEKLGKMAQIDDEKAKTEKRNIEWDNVIRKSRGIKIKDDEFRVKSALKKRDKRKLNSSKKWNERIKTNKHLQRKKQTKRNENIQKRSNDKVNRRIRKAINRRMKKSR
ncbi:hypothetical protein A3Q56_05865 [Intoshia linei]|uniref:Ribosomal RNA-processing protein 14/surfeit locus protein 6 C-terminal domain-containing protein n=1 Tax=Intoshia linei TaxID=1819745 RepID=A0A177AX00_9BILA|nr:hypothetical protein A3Q56_05865 [Intoshia linei]